jgi:outer membrane protein assembly factor BamB
MKNGKPNLPAIVLLLLVLNSSCDRGTPIVGNGESIPSQMPQVDIFWPSLANSLWPMYLHDPQHTGRSPYRGPQEGKVEWLFETGREVYSSPAIGPDGIVYFSSEDGFLYAVTASGNLRWKVNLGARTDCSPLVTSNGKIYVSSTSDFLFCINIGGQILWQYELSCQTAVTQPTISPNGDIIYLQTSGVRCSSSIYAIHEDGSLKWRFISDDLSPYSPALSPDGSTLYSPAYGGLYAVDTSGVVKWHYGLDPSLPNSPTRSNSPSVDNAGNIYFTSGKYCYSLSPEGALRWKYNTAYSYAGITPTIGYDGTIYVVGAYNQEPDVESGGYGRIYALDYQGKLKWNYDSIRGDKQIATTAIIDRDNTLYVGMITHRSVEDSVNFVTVGENGTIQLQLSLRSPDGTVPDIDSTPAISANSRIYMGSDRPHGRHLYAVY